MATAPKKIRIGTIRGAKQSWSDSQFLIFKPDRLREQNGVEQGQKGKRPTRKTVQGSIVL